MNHIFVFDDFCSFGEKCFQVCLYRFTAYLLSPFGDKIDGHFSSVGF